MSFHDPAETPVDAGGYSIKLTADHRVWTKSRGWVEAQNLTTSDEVRWALELPKCVES